MSDMAELARRNAWGIARDLATGEVSPVALTRFLLAQAETQSAENVYLNIMGQRALADAASSAERLEKGRPRSAFEGVPIAFKDLFDIKGEVTSAGSPIYEGAPAAKADATAVARARAAGMVILGKLNLTEFAYSGLGLNPYFGTPLNPHSRTEAHIPGGSSSGSGVAVARGLAPLTIGTDTGGSVRIPAAFNGIVGFKPSEGRFDKSGVFALSPTLDTIGPLARTVQDCIAMDMVLRGRPVQKQRPRTIAGQRLLVPENMVLEGLEPAVAANFERSVELLARAGGHIERLKLDAFSRVMQLTADHGTITAAEAFQCHQQLMESAQKELVDQRVAARIMAGAKMGTSKLKFLRHARLRLIEEFNSSVGEALVLMPTTPMVAPELDPLKTDDGLFHKTNILALRNTSLGNFLNMPGLALPNGIDKNSMPTSLLVSATDGQDSALLRTGLEIERLHEKVRLAPPQT